MCFSGNLLSDVLITSRRGFVPLDMMCSVNFWIEIDLLHADAIHLECVDIRRPLCVASMLCITEANFMRKQLIRDHTYYHHHYKTATIVHIIHSHLPILRGWQKESYTSRWGILQSLYKTMCQEVGVTSVQRTANIWMCNADAMEVILQAQIIELTSMFNFHRNYELTKASENKDAGALVTCPVWTFLSNFVLRQEVCDCRYPKYSDVMPCLEQC